MKYVIINDEKSAVEYIQMILDRWDSWQTHHTALVQALKILVSAHKLLTEVNKTITKLLVEKTVTVIEFDKQIERLTEENERLRERNVALEQKLMILGCDEQYIFKAQVKGE